MMLVEFVVVLVCCCLQCIFFKFGFFATFHPNSDFCTVLMYMIDHSLLSFGLCLSGFLFRSRNSFNQLRLLWIMCLGLPFQLEFINLVNKIGYGAEHQLFARVVSILANEECL